MKSRGLLYGIFHNINVGDLDIDVEVILDNSNNEKTV